MYAENAHLSVWVWQIMSSLLTLLFQCMVHAIIHSHLKNNVHLQSTWSESGIVIVAVSHEPCTSCHCVTNSKHWAVTKSKIMEGAKNNRSEQGCDRNYGNCWGWTINKITCILVNKLSNGDNNVKCMRRLILGISFWLAHRLDSTAMSQ